MHPTAEAISGSKTAGSRTPEIEAAIRRRAEELYRQRGGAPGDAVEDWLKAEAEVLCKFEVPAESKPAYLVIRLHGVTYTGEYDARDSGGYQPGEFAAGEPIRVRFEGEMMFIRRPNGSELSARVVKKSP
jgi:hypothetical protein